MIVPRLASLRIRLVVAFLLVSVPPMLAASYVATRLIAGAFEDNVEQWLGETTKYLLLQIRESQIESARLAQIFARGMGATGFAGPADQAKLAAELEFATATGYDMVVLYDAGRKILFSLRELQPAVKLPLATQDALLVVKSGDARRILAGAVQSFERDGAPLFVLVGAWVDDESLGGIKIVSSLDLRLYTRDEDRLVPVFATGSEAGDRPLSDAIIARLKARDEPVYDDNEDSSTYRAVYAGLRDSDNQLAGVVFTGLSQQESFYPRIGGWELFVFMFALGSILSILAGLWMSGLLVRPLKALSSGVRSVTAGDYQQRVKVAGGTEVEELATSFNSMAAQLSTLKGLEADLRRRDRLSALGEAAMVIAHEVRNPLGIIQASAEVVRLKARLAPAEDKLLGYVVDEVRRIEELVRGFLDFAHPKPPESARVEMRGVVNRVAAFAAPEFERRKIVFAIEDHARHAAVDGDADQLHQAVLNLVLNAMDAMPAGGRLTARIDRSGETCSLTLEDTGAGVHPDAEARLFDPFFTTKARGSGLGLAKVRTVAEAHGGTATYARAASGGAAFAIALPLAPPPQGGRK